jgi:hypothetical protein
MTDATGLMTGDHARIRPLPAVPGKFAHDLRPAARQGPGTASGLAGAGETDSIARRWPVAGPVAPDSACGGTSGSSCLLRPIRAQHRDRRRIAVQVDVLLPPDGPDFVGAHASHQAHNDVGIISEAGRRRSFSPVCRSSAGGACRRCTARSGGRRGRCHDPLGALPPSGSMHRWFPAAATWSPISVSKMPSSCKTWWAQLGSNQRPLACKTLPICRLPSLTWEIGHPCHSLDRLESYVVVVNDGGQHPSSRLRRAVGRQQSAARS